MAQVDTGIYQNLLRPVKSVQEYDAEAQQAEGNKLGLLLQRGQYDAQQRGVADDAAYRDAVKGFGADSGANANMLRARGLGKQAMDYEKSALDAGKTAAEVANLKKTGAKTDSDLMDASLKRYRAGLDFIESPQGAVKWLQAQYQDPALSALMNSRGPFEEAIKHIPQTPAEFDQWRQRVAMGIENYSKKLQEDRKQAENERDNKAKNGIAAGNLRVAQGGLGLRDREFSYQKGKDSQDRTDKISGISGSSQATEGERKAATLLTRLRGSKAQLDSVLARDSSAAKPGVVAEVARGIPFVGGDTAANLATGESRQQVEAAQLDMLDAALTLGTGAAYTKEQLRGYARSYFPQIGDDKRTVADKAQRLKTVIEAAEIAAGRADPKRGRTSNGGASGEWGGGWSIQEVK